jgi:hypothetical protein
VLFEDQMLSIGSFEQLQEKIDSENDYWTAITE